MISTFVDAVLLIVAVLILLNFLGDLIVRYILLRFFVHEKIKAMYWEYVLIHTIIDGYHIHKLANMNQKFDELLYNGKKPEVYILDLIKDLQNRLNWCSCRPDGKPLNIIERVLKRYMSVVLRGLTDTFEV